MDQVFLQQMAGERVARRHADAAAERLSHAARVADAPLEPAGGPIWGVRRSVGFLLVRVGLRTALGDARC